MTPSSAYIDSFSLGIGAFAENLGDNIQKEGETSGSTEGLNPDIFFRGVVRGDLIIDATWEFEIGSSIPSSSQDSSVTKWNYWTNLFIQKRFSLFEPQLGLGFYFTRLSVDGSTKTLQNGSQPSTTFQTPEGAVVATNNVVIIGMNHYPTYLFDDGIHLNIQLSFLNIEDSQESSKSLFLSMNYKLGQL